MEVGVNRFIVKELPNSIDAWMRVEAEDWIATWELLRPFFLSVGYELYHVSSRFQTRPLEASPSNTDDSFGFYGDRSPPFAGSFSWMSRLYGARDRQHRDVVIKVVAKGQEGIQEFEINRLLNAEPLRSRPENHNIPVLDFLSYEDWKFIVMPPGMGAGMPMNNASEFFEFADQLLTGLTFLHQNRVAHLDITNPNVLMNFRGRFNGEPGAEFRSTFPVRYMILDYGISHHFAPTSDPITHLIKPFKTLHRYQAPESAGPVPHDPFASDVYMTARLLYDWIHTAIADFPDLLPLFQDMSSPYPPNRISMLTARDRLRMLRPRIPTESLTTPRRLIGGRDGYPPIPMDMWRSLRDYIYCLLARLRYACLGIPSLPSHPM